MSTTTLTGELVLRAVYDPTTGGLLTTPSTATAFAIELDAADGDNVTTKADASVTAVTTAVSAVGMKTINLYVNPGTATTVKIQISGEDSGSNFMDLPSGSIANDLTLVKSTGPLTICARRAQVVVVSGAATYSLVLQGN